MILTQLGDLNSAEEHLHLALEIHGLDRRRTRAIVLADLAGVRLRQGDTDGALATWSEFLTCAEGVRSVKVQAALNDMQVRLRRFQGMAKADELQQSAAHLTKPQS
jgi:ATP/maltotriose-dependent transcriptional regulator MalT